MDKFLITGPCKIKGQVSISGSKNAALPILASTLLFDKPVIIENLPQVRDIDTMLNLLKSLGSKIQYLKNKKTVKISKTTKPKHFASYSLVKTMRAGILVLGPLVAKYHKSITSLPGGCTIGARPVNYHLNALKKLGMKYEIKKGYIHASSKGKLKGANIKFSKISVGATENSIIAACLANGKTILKNCAIEPEIKDLTNFLKSAGANIKWIGKRTCQIIGVNSLNQTTYSVMGDRIETGTFCVAATLAKGDLVIKNFNPNVIQTELNLLKKVGAKIKTSKNEINIKGPKKIKNITNITTKEYPNFPTDLQAQFMVLLCKANGRSTITESIFENRFMHVAELRRLGARIIVKDNKATIEGKTEFLGAELMSSDLRASVALVLAAIVAKGQSTINRIYHLDRGYEKIENKLKKIGVKIKRLS
ncbi:MAG: UDP-N-acetylglucosamine 1-carboxyvinyltransferase [Rhodobacteraceae bacterium]|jgi:UDP-N-acetylglucosamine 1-carboxyvinyltransferase|nr:UDP-N-acetylglucosamine 1-carboxyvinyltransferase [Paracoccaceae bacterium]|tara:strand:- start:2078 stop:3340 length:1263 start_codon:yes stop_codon:yes gene_type:complete